MAKCSLCNGSGECPNCFGSGKFDCPTCNATGSVTDQCAACGGSGVDVSGETCRVCNGSGSVTVPCRSCNGKGSFPCEQCNGTGRCKHCGGTGIEPGTSLAVEALATTDIDLESEAKARFETWFRRTQAGQPCGTGRILGYVEQNLDVADVNYTSIQYGAITRRQQPPFKLDSYHDRNDSSTQDSFTYASRKTTAATVTTQVTHSVRTTKSVSLHVGVPVIGASGSLTEEIDFTTNDTKQDSINQEWSWSKVFYVAPYTETEVSVIVAQQTAEIPINAVMRVSGVLRVKMSMHCPDLSDSTNFIVLRAAPLGDLFGFTPAPWVHVVDYTTIEVNVSALMKVDSGIDLTISKESSPIPH